MSLWTSLRMEDGSPNGRATCPTMLWTVHVSGPRKNKIAYYWEGENGEKRKFTYNDLYVEVNKFASALKKLGREEGG